MSLNDLKLFFIAMIHYCDMSWLFKKICKLDKLDLGILLQYYRFYSTKYLIFHTIAVLLMSTPNVLKDNISVAQLLGMVTKYNFNYIVYSLVICV